jgi:hypothetical protein
MGLVHSSKTRESVRSNSTQQAAMAHDSPVDAGPADRAAITSADCKLFQCTPEEESPRSFDLVCR